MSDGTDEDVAEPTPRRRRWRRWVLAGVAVVALAIGGFVWWFFSDDAPDEVNLSDAAAQVGGTATSTAGAGTTGSSAGGVVTTATPPATAGTAPTTATDDVTGTWAVDTSIGEFDFEDSTGTFVGFRVEEELASIGSTTAVGRTPAVDGSLTIDGTTVTEVSITADMTSITTNDSRRDDAVQRALDTSEFPTATFVLTSPLDLGAEAAAGEPVTVDATGDLTIHGVTTPVTIPLEAQLVGETIVVVGQLDIAFGDYGVEVPTSPIVVSAEDEGVLELQLFFTR